MSVYSKTLYVRRVNPGTDSEFMISGPKPEDVSDTAVLEEDTVDAHVARYVLAGVGSVRQSAAVYMEHASAG